VYGSNVPLLGTTDGRRSGGNARASAELLMPRSDGWAPRTDARHYQWMFRHQCQCPSDRAAHEQSALCWHHALQYPARV